MLVWPSSKPLESARPGAPLMTPLTTVLPAPVKLRSRLGEAEVPAPVLIAPLRVRVLVSEPMTAAIGKRDIAGGRVVAGHAFQGAAAVGAGTGEDEGSGAEIDAVAVVEAEAAAG